jgi:hypothetical protein
MMNAFLLILYVAVIVVSYKGTIFTLEKTKLL